MIGDDAAVFESGVLVAMACHGPQIRLASGGRQDGESAGGEAEGADAIGIHMIVIAPGVEHVVRQHFQLTRALPDFHGAAVVMPAVAVVGERRGDEPGLRQGDGRVEMTGVGATVSVRHDHQGQVVATDRRVPGDLLRRGFDPFGLCVGFGRIPDAHLYGLAVRIGDEDMLETDGGADWSDGEGEKAGEGHGDEAGHQGVRM
jgi:hypothetical protein